MKRERERRVLSLSESERERENWDTTKRKKNDRKRERGKNNNNNNNNNRDDVKVTFAVSPTFSYWPIPNMLNAFKTTRKTFCEWSKIHLNTIFLFF